MRTRDRTSQNLTENMPQVTAQGRTFSCPVGANLRQVLLANEIELYNGNAKFINCMGIGTCGTCAVEIEGEVSAPNWKDNARRSLPPHDRDRPLRLACQTQVLGDIRVTKYRAFWGQGNEIQW
jgi:ferredoxin